MPWHLSLRCLSARRIPNYGCLLELSHTQHAHCTDLHGNCYEAAMENMLSSYTGMPELMEARRKRAYSMAGSLVGFPACLRCWARHTQLRFS